MVREKFHHYSKETEFDNISMRTTIVKIDTDSTGKLYGKLIIKIKDIDDTKEHVEKYNLSKAQIDAFRKFKITPTFDKLSGTSKTISRTTVKNKRPKPTRKNRRNVTRRG